MIRVFTAFMVLACPSPQTLESRQNTVVVFETEKGTIEMEVDGARAPATAANFLKYVDAGFYDGGSVNRSVTRTTLYGMTSRSRSFSFRSTRRGAASSFRRLRWSAPVSRD